MIAAKHVMRYLKGTIYFFIYYVQDHDYILYGYTDAYWVGSVLDRKITLDGCYCLGSSMISWFSGKQFNVSLIIVEAEYIASFSASCEAIRLSKVDFRSILPRFGYHGDYMGQPKLHKDDEEPSVP